MNDKEKSQTDNNNLSESYTVIIKDGKKKMYITNTFTNPKEDVREKVADIILKQ